MFVYLCRSLLSGRDDIAQQKRDSFIVKAAVQDKKAQQKRPPPPKKPKAGKSFSPANGGDRSASFHRACLNLM
jgi:hypothetical protein